ncbi:MAG: hypothetical protein ACE5OY_06770 [Candidatus Bathyarchaeia archaeon]
MIETASGIVVDLIEVWVLGLPLSLFALGFFLFWREKHAKKRHA